MRPPSHASQGVVNGCELPPPSITTTARFDVASPNLRLDAASTGAETAEAGLVTIPVLASKATTSNETAVVDRIRRGFEIIREY